MNLIKHMNESDDKTVTLPKKKAIVDQGFINFINIFFFF